MGVWKQPPFVVDRHTMARESIRNNMSSYILAKFPPFNVYQPLYNWMHDKLQLIEEYNHTQL